MNFVIKVGPLCNSLIIRGKSLRYLSCLQKSQWFSSNKLKGIQKRRLRLLLQHAYNNVPYYHKLFKTRHLRPQNIRSIEELAKMPIISKEDFRDSFWEFVSRNFQTYRPRLNSTSGSTGEPFRYYLGREATAIANAALWRGWGYAGYRFGDKMAVLAGLSLVPEKQSPFSQIISRTIFRKTKLPAINLRRNILKQYAKKIMRFKPKFIRGYPSSLYFFADFLKEEGLDDIRPKDILTTAEMLFPYQRKLLEEVFHCEVFDGFGALDGGTTAFECEEHSGYHIAMEKTIMEFLDKNGNPVTGERGRIIATDLYNYAMPFIRYDTGDMGVLSDETCQCGRGLPLMKEILGRTTDILKFKNGSILSGPSLTLIFKDFDIKQYQLIQRRDDSLSVKLIKGKTYTEEDTLRLHMILRKNIGEGVEIEFDFVDCIPTTEIGKWKLIISEAKS